MAFKDAIGDSDCRVSFPGRQKPTLTQSVCVFDFLGLNLPSFSRIVHPTLESLFSLLNLEQF